MILDTVQEASEEPPEPVVQMLCCERAPKRLSSPNVPATAIPVRSTKGHDDNIYFEAAQDSRHNWALLNLENKHAREAGLRFTKRGQEGQLSILSRSGGDRERQLLT